MARRMSCSLTIDAVRSRTKTVTRRHISTWKNVGPGETLTLVEKAMGLPKGAKQVVLAEVVIVDVSYVRLWDIDQDECDREMWCESHSVPEFRDQNEAMRYVVRRIEWRYL